MKDSTVTARINSHLKREAEDILKKIGLSSSTAISLFYSTVVLNKGLPFRLRLDSVPTMGIEEQKETEKILKKHSPSDKRIVKSESIEVSL
ncbi:MAG: DNA-damage-inducible protein J [Stygiobacter sp.]|nr:MAG: DNA-damage-inducible protein J [Stygiobacter sp.]KAF0162190.1 MAG: DNA-damage-inducible protein J [Ignavibacteria bacterium]KAF0217646.1 MAG: DNA-damage-inducible protein [Ignavibacteria bacterium]